jgi:hypothetical protein
MNYTKEQIEALISDGLTAKCKSLLILDHLMRLVAVGIPDNKEYGNFKHIFFEAGCKFGYAVYNDLGKNGRKNLLKALEDNEELNLIKHIFDNIEKFKDDPTSLINCKIDHGADLLKEISDEYKA